MTPLVPGFVVITATGYFNAGSNGAPPGHVQTTTPQVTEDVSMVRGAHEIQFGGNFIKPIENFVINLATFGNFNFNGGITGKRPERRSARKTQHHPAGQRGRSLRSSEILSGTVHSGQLAGHAQTLNINATAFDGHVTSPPRPSTAMSAISIQARCSSPTPIARCLPATASGAHVPGDPGYPGKVPIFDQRKPTLRRASVWCVIRAATAEMTVQVRRTAGCFTTCFPPSLLRLIVQPERALW